MSSPAVTQVVLVIRVMLGLLLIPLAWRRSGSPLDLLATFGLACACYVDRFPCRAGALFHAGVACGSIRFALDMEI